MTILVPIQIVFTIWMAADAYRRQAEMWWIFIIILFQPIGAWVYFFAVKIGDFQGGIRPKGWSLFQRKASLEELRYRAEQTPTFKNHLSLAERLIEKSEHAEAVPHLEKALAREPQHCTTLYLLATCRSALGRPESAIPELQKLIATDQSWANYAGWRKLIEVKKEANDRAGAVQTCRDLANVSPTLQNRCLLAEHLIDNNLGDEAKSLLEKSLTEHRFMPPEIRRKNRHWASVAKHLKRQASAGTS